MLMKAFLATAIFVLLCEFASAQYDPYGGGFQQPQMQMQIHPHHSHGWGGGGEQQFSQRQPQPQSPVDGITAHPMLASAIFQFGQFQLYQQQQNFQQVLMMQAQQAQYVQQLQQMNIRYQMEKQYEQRRRGLFRR